ncbi:MAG TPA: BTAD domain-containing putative transcriptional regulator, partial [Longimicrobium sp.]|nr:BTAD domain-containing putative transcriptional regulator [Longimicrobium sp.]
MFALKVLGDPVLLGPDGPVSGRAAYKRRMALLAVFAVARGRPVGRERVIGLLWPEHATGPARHTLSESLYVLRRELGEDVFTTVGDEIALSPAALPSDVAAFQEALEQGRLEEGVAQYGGPLLDGFFVSDAPEFERWVDTERDRLARACGDALERLAEQAQASGSLLEAVTWWRRLAAHDPYSSRVALRLAQTLDAAGERGAALRACGVHAVRLREELGVEPDASLSDFVERLRAEPPRPVGYIRISPPSLSAPPVPPALSGIDPTASPGDGDDASVESPAGDGRATASVEAGEVEGRQATAPAGIPSGPAGRARRRGVGAVAVATLATVVLGAAVHLPPPSPAPVEAPRYD